VGAGQSRKTDYGGNDPYAGCFSGQVRVEKQAMEGNDPHGGCFSGQVRVEKQAVEGNDPHGGHGYSSQPQL
jgi:hypothetical protein